MAIVVDQISTPPRPQTASSTNASNSTAKPPSSVSASKLSPATTTTTTIEFLSSPSSWKPRRRRQPPKPSTTSYRCIISRRMLRWIMLTLCLTLTICLYRTIPSHHQLLDLSDDNLLSGDPRSLAHQKHDSKPSSALKPNDWIRLNSHPSHHLFPHHPSNKKPHPPASLYAHPIFHPPSHPRAALISLVRSSELRGMLQSIRQLEYNFNSHPSHHYPWHFFSESPFTADFINATTSATSSKTHYHLIPRAHWSPNSTTLNTPHYHTSLSSLSALGIGKAHLPSYRSMCRWNSGFFYLHPALLSYDYYWRIEPDVHFSCYIAYDPFALFARFGLIYGFNMAILEDARSFGSLWGLTRRFVEDECPECLHREAKPAWLMDGDSGGGYNNCQFFSNFEIGDLNFFRGTKSEESGDWSALKANQRYFEYLDSWGGFWYERFGDAPVHTLSVSLFAPRGKIWFFGGGNGDLGGVGYQHDIARYCPGESSSSRGVVGSGGSGSGLFGGTGGRCSCEPTKLDENFYKLVPMESRQRKPGDSCLRMWLDSGDEDGEGKDGWLEKKEGWSREAEIVVGGDGLGGYVKEQW